MEFNEKLQELRKKKGLTQEELAELLHVSRAAVSKWESGRGFPNIDSLKTISGLFSVSLDDLLSGERLLAIAEDEHKEREGRTKDIIVGMLDLFSILVLFLPLFGQASGDAVGAVTLWDLTGAKSYIKIAYFTAILLLTLCGVLTLVLRGLIAKRWHSAKVPLSLSLGSVAVLLFIAGRQPYAASFMFVLASAKGILLLKRQ